MVAYEFYQRREKTGDQLVGILPERRQHGERITQQSIMNWVRGILGNHADGDLDGIYFIQVEV